MKKVVARGVTFSVPDNATQDQIAEIVDNYFNEQKETVKKKEDTSRRNLTGGLPPLVSPTKRADTESTLQNSSLASTKQVNANDINQRPILGGPAYNEFPTTSQMLSASGGTPSETATQQPIDIDQLEKGVAKRQIQKTIETPGEIKKAPKGTFAPPASKPVVEQQPPKIASEGTFVQEPIDKDLYYNKSITGEIKAAPEGTFKRQTEEKAILNQKEYDTKIDTFDKQTKEYNTQLKDFYDQQKKVEDLGFDLRYYTVDQVAASPELTAKYNSYVEQYNSLSDKAKQLDVKQKEMQGEGVKLDALVGQYLENKENPEYIDDSRFAKLTKPFNNNIVSRFTKAVYNGVVTGFEKAAKGVAYISAEYTAPPLMKTEGEQKEFEDAAKEYGFEKPKDVSFDDWRKTLSKDDQTKIVEKIIDIRKKEYLYGSQTPSEFNQFSSATTEAKKEQQKGALSKIQSVFDEAKFNTKLSDEAIKKTTFGGAIIGLAEFAPTMASAVFGGAPAAWSAAIESHASIMDEMKNNPTFDKMNESDKFLVALPFDLVNAAFMSHGLSGYISDKSVTGYFVKKVLDAGGQNMTAGELKILIDQEVKNSIANRTIKTIIAGEHGGVMGAGMGASDLALKWANNQREDISGKFDLPKDPIEAIKTVSKSAVGLIIGSGIMAMPNIISRTPIKDFDNNTFAIFDNIARDPKFAKAMQIKMQNEINAGTITVAEAKAKLALYNKYASQMNNIPEDMSVQAKKDALVLLEERQKLQDAISGKDPLLVKDQQKRIDEINEKLSNVTKPEYTIDGIEYTKDEFLKKIDEMSPEYFKKAQINVKNDQTIIDQLNKKINAVQEPSTEKQVLPSKQPELGLREMEQGDKGRPSAEVSSITPQTGTSEPNLPETVTPETETTVEPAQKEGEVTAEDIERRRQEELKGQYGSGFRLEKMTETVNEELTDRNVGSVEKAIQLGIQQGKSASEILGILNALGFVPANFGNGTEALRNYLQSRIDGSNITYQQVHANGILTEINAKYDAELKALEESKSKEPAPKEGEGTEPLKDIESTTKALEFEDKNFNELQSLYDEFEESNNKEVLQLSDLIENVQQKKERNSILNSSLDKVSEVIDSILKNKHPFIDKKDARESKEIAEKYTKEVSKSEAKKDFKDAFFGNPNTWNADALKMREAVRVYIENGGTFKDLLSSVKKEFQADGFTENDAAKVIKNKLESFTKKDFRQEQIAEAYHKAKSDGSNPELVKAVEEAIGKPAPKEGEVKFGTAFEMQDNTAENTVGKNKDKWGESQLWRERIENAGDILRELSSRGDKPDPTYILEKVNKIKQWLDKNKKQPIEKIPNDIKTLDDFKKTNLKFTNIIDGYEYLTKFNSDILEKTKKEYEAIHTYTKEQRLATDLVIDLINNNINGLESKLNKIEEIANKIKKEGKLEIIPDIKMGSKSKEPAPKEGEAPTEPTKTKAEEAKDLLAEGLSNLADALGAKKSATGDKAKLISDAVKQIARALIKAGEATVENVHQKVKEYIKREWKEKFTPEVEQQIDAETKSIEQHGEIFDNIKSVVDAMRKAKRPESEIEEQALKIIEQSDAYKNTDPNEREKLVRDIYSDTGIKQKRPPSAQKILGQPEPAKQSMTQAQLNQARQKAAQGGAKFEREIAEQKIDEIKQNTKDQNERRKQLGDFIKDMLGKLNITPSKVESIVGKITRVNLNNLAKINEVLDYVDKISKDAEYDNKLNSANALRKALKEEIRNPDVDAHIKNAAEAFLKIKPSSVEDIGEYTERASRLKEAAKGTKDNEFARTVDVKEYNEYSEKNIKRQEEERLNTLRKQIQKITGIDTSNMTYDELMSMKEESTGKDEEEIEKMKQRSKSVFDSLSAYVNKMIETGRDPITDEPVDVSDRKAGIIMEYLRTIDPTKMTLEEINQAIDAANNFIVNGSISKLLTDAARNKGKENSEIDSETKRAKKSSKAGFFILKGLGTLPMVFEHLFGTPKRAIDMMNRMGINNLRMGGVRGNREANMITSKYVEKFNKTKPNGEEFSSDYNQTERTIISTLMRYRPGKEVEDFNMRKEWIEQSIDNLRNGNEEQQKAADVAEDVYNKILKDSNSIDEMLSKSDGINKDAVDYWIKNYKKNYDLFSETAESIYNKTLGNDENYTPDVKRKLKEKITEADDNESVFDHGNRTLYTREAGILMRPKYTPLGKDQYIDFNFDRNVSEAMKNGLIDAYTAEPLRYMKAYINSEGFKKIIPDTEIRDMLYDRMIEYGRDVRNKAIIEKSDFKELNKIYTAAASFGTKYALTSTFQYIKQLTPLVSTFINAFPTNAVNNFFLFADIPKMNWLNNTNMDIAQRGGDVYLEQANELIKKAATSKGDKIFELTNKAGEMYLRSLLVNPDVGAAKASWMAYYEKALKEKGIEPSEIDYNIHEIDQDAADYAQHMVDRQQNVSVKNLQGDLFKSKTPSLAVIRQTFFNLAQFRMNQFVRHVSDWRILKDGTATPKEKLEAAGSISGLLAEMAAFKAISGTVSYYLGSAANAILGINETDERKQKRYDDILKAQKTSAVTDLLSPFPVTDPYIQKGFYEAWDSIENLEKIPEEEKKNIFETQSGRDAFANTFNNLGGVGIAGKKIYDFIDLCQVAYSDTIKDKYGQELYLDPEDKSKLKQVVGIYFLSLFNPFPADVRTIIDKMVKESKSYAKTDKKLWEEREGSLSESNIQENKVETSKYSVKGAE